MAHRFREILVLAVGLGLVLLAAPAPGGAAELPAKERKLLEAFTALEDGRLSASQARNECLLNLVTSEIAPALREISSGFFGVSSSHALVRLCDALIVAVAAGDLSSDTIRVVVVDGDDDETQGYELGRMLRAVYFAPGS